MQRAVWGRPVIDKLDGPSGAGPSTGRATDPLGRVRLPARTGTFLPPLERKRRGSA